MARPATGSVRSRVRNGHPQLTLRFSAYGQRYELPAGTDDETRARARLDEILDQVKRGSWQPPRPVKVAPPRGVEPTFGEFAEQWFKGRAGSLTPRGREDYLWALNNHLLPYFTEMLLSEITIQTVDEYRQAKLEEGKLNGTSVNKTIARLAQILDLALEYGHIQANPARGKRRRAKASPPRRTYLETEQVLAVLDAGGELDREANGRYERNGRRAIMATLILTGLRAGELCDLRWLDVDLTNRKLYVRDSKTQAGIRVVPISGFLHEALSDYRAHAVESEYAFPTATGRPRNKDNLRLRVHNPVIKRANENLAKGSRPLIQPGLTPARIAPDLHQLAARSRRDVRSVMAWAGHNTPNITLAIYGQVLTNPGSREVAQRLLWKPGERGVDADLRDNGHQVQVLEADPEHADVVRAALPGVDVLACDACEVTSLQRAGLREAEVVVAATGDDEDNLVISWLSKQEFAVPRVISRVNNAKNAWMFNESWGVDVERLDAPAAHRARRRGRDGRLGRAAHGPRPLRRDARRGHARR